MNDNDNRLLDCMWHYSREFLLEADAVGRGRVLRPRLIRRARRLCRRSQYIPVAPTITVKVLSDERFDRTRSVEVVPLGCYTVWHKMAQDMREQLRADVVTTIECDDHGISSVRWNSGSGTTEGLARAVTVVSCNGKFYPMLVIARHGR